MNSLTIIFVTFNSHAVISNSLVLLVDDSNFKVIVVDNNSSDGTVALIRERFPSVDVIEQEQNIGYGRAANVALRKTITPYALLLNADIITNTADIKKLLLHAIEETSNTAIWAPTTDSKEFGEGPPVKVKWVSGSVMLFNVEKIRGIGLFDENIFLFSEETDLCERTVMAGFTIKLCRDVFFKHLSGQSCPPSDKTEYMRWWHFGWSQCYRIVKNGHITLFRNPRNKYLGYLIHSFTATSKTKRMKWKAKSDGALAYIHGEKAFRADGSPQMS
jgi:N-acetylglucosaminyl-diphospho-decaprenol L-rhamnosyltransferase